MSNGDGLPKGWCWTTVGQAGEVRLGRQRSPKNRSGKYPTKYLRAGNITWAGLDLADVLEMDFKPSERETYCLQRGDILLSEASGSASEVGKPAIWGGQIENCCFQNTVVRFRPRVASSKFACTVFRHFAENGVFAKTGKGIGIHHLGADRFSQLPFPIPPTNEQRRIVAKIEELFSDLDAGVAALERAKAKLKRYRAAVLKAAVEGKLTEDWRAQQVEAASRRFKERTEAKRRDAASTCESGPQLLERILKERRRKWEEDQLAVYAKAGKKPPANWKEKYKEPVAPDETDLLALPEGWGWTSIGQCFPVCVGATPSRREPSYWEGSIPWASSGEIQFCRIKETEEQITELGLANSSTQVNPRGSVLIGMIGEGRTRGQVAILDIDACNNKNSAAIWVSQTQMPPEYVYYWLWSQYEITRRRSSGNNQPALNKARVEEIPLPLPPLAEQQQIVSEVEQRLSLVAAAESQIEANLKRSSRLRQSILKRAFEGKLVPQDPNDEPASVLLERIRVPSRGNSRTQRTHR